MERQTQYSIFLCIAVAVVYHNALGCGFVFDDMSAIVENKDLRPTTKFVNLFLNDFWGTPMHKEKSHKSYRPLCVSTFRLNYMLGELNPVGYHLLNVILHAIVCILFMRVCMMFVSETTSFLSALLFALHPIHTEAVTGVVGRAESLSSIFFMAAFISYTKSTGYQKKTEWKPLVLTVFLVTVAMLCKEQGITVIGVCCVYEIFVEQKCTIQELLQIFLMLLQGKTGIPDWLKKSILRGSFLVFSTTFLLFARIKVMGAQLPVFTSFDNPASQSATPTRQLTYNYLLSINGWLLLNPSRLCCDWTMGTIELITSVLDPRNMATVLFYVILVISGLYAISNSTQRSRAVVMGLSFLILPFIPASNLFFPVGFVVAERILYTPSFGFCLLVALGCQLLMQKFGSKKSLIACLMAGLLVTHGIKTLVRNYDWENEYTIFRAGLRVNQGNAKLFNNVGHALEKFEKWEEALVYFEKAASVQPDDIGAHINVGRTYRNLNRSAPAERAYHTAIKLFPPIVKGRSYQARVAPSHLNAYLNLANLISTNESRLEEAGKWLRQAIAMREDFIEAYINLGDIFMKLGKVDEARRTYEHAIIHEPTNADLFYNLGVVLLEEKKTTEARKNFELALLQNPDHWQSLYNSAILMQEGGNPNERELAMQRLDKLKDRDSLDPKVFFNYAMVAMDDLKFHVAESNFRQAIEMDPAFRSALFNLALMLVNNLNRPLEAAPVLKQLLKHYPDHTKGLILMGDINVNHIKDLNAAEENFMSILKREPSNYQAMHNLCVVFVEKGDLLRGEKCLIKALELNPSADYIQQHLNIVRTKIAQVRQKMAADQKEAEVTKKTKNQEQNTDAKPSH